MAVKVALLWPEATVTLAGTVRLALLLERATLAPDVDATVRVTVHVDVPGALTVAGEQLSVGSTAASYFTERSL